MKFEDMNDLDLSKWREYDYVKTNSIWVDSFSRIPTKDFGSSSFQGRFIPEIPYQMMLRYTRKEEKVWDCFAGGGTTLDVGKMLHRRVYANDVKSTRPDIVQADSRYWSPPEKVQLVIMHPPYWNMVKFTELSEDLGNALSLEKFLKGFEACVQNVASALEDERVLILVISDVYHKGEQIPLDFYCFRVIKRCGFILKGRIVKDFGETRGTEKTQKKFENLWRYRRLKGGFWELGIDHILIFQKKKEALSRMNNQIIKEGGHNGRN